MQEALNNICDILDSIPKDKRQILLDRINKLYEEPDVNHKIMLISFASDNIKKLIIDNFKNNNLDICLYENINTDINSIDGFKIFHLHMIGSRIDKTSLTYIKLKTISEKYDKNNSLVLLTSSNSGTSDPIPNNNQLFGIESVVIYINTFHKTLNCVNSRTIESMNRIKSLCL